MKTQTSKSQIYCPMAAIRYARVLYEVGVPKEAVQKTREIFEEVPQLHEIFANPTIELQKKMNVVDRVFPKEIRNFLKVACRYQRMNLIEDIFTAYDRYCDEQNQVLNAVLTCIQPPTEEQKKGMEAFLCKKYGAKTIAFAGSVTKEAVACNEAGIDAFFPIVRGISTLEEAMDPDTAKANMAATAEQVFRLL